MKSCDISPSVPLCILNPVMKRQNRKAGHATHTANEKELGAISRFLSFALRHGPDKVGIGLDSNGWASIEELVRQSNRCGRRLSPELIRTIVATSDKQRFAISGDGLYIRANQGHSIAAIDVALAPVEPPKFLFHGTAQRFVASILTTGISKRSRNHVHLSADESTAIHVGQRHGKPVVLRILARAMHAEGHEFFLSANGVWLTDHVPLRFIQSTG
ncbi:MAG: RNA 2'-phosphotransferase [Gallionella sp.]|nr:RNA 2'-phosphotransferase [Gallionella sp.]